MAQQRPYDKQSQDLKSKTTPSKSGSSYDDQNTASNKGFGSKEKTIQSTQGSDGMKNRDLKDQSSADVSRRSSER